MSERLAQSLRSAAHAHAASARTEPPTDPADLRLNLAELLQLHGDSSTAVVLMLMALLTVVPIAGAGTVLSLGILVIAWGWARGRDSVDLPDRLGALSLNERWTGRCLHGLAWMYERANRWLRPRWLVLSHGATRWGWGVWIALMAGVIFLPLPLGNVLPSMSLILLSLGWMFRDGMALAVSALTGCAALAYTASLAHLLVQLVDRARGWLPI
ncbi:MAG: exopolysaccharide biosynthesis protein [Hydrogenophaga sp.]|uniref:exopolysaccharide biosynthesis protein n=1 Tax=Hydrogenophaga sp. TaxID=1904254 RepID=UPI0027303B68|nr:exopolysaccharide biosynthesis protein [Hydrogenophaga sp.]MDP1782393.1 exopolysaccharide biosynthesis protein [Hydrogenophaga sp.]MDP2249268.1 exopolysaccharide biosynthesis protein [Hydrogenophaga sp.]MDZ4124833.1 exopolysaccharide biosynthesis protein [Hydrogenophaga sp.]